MVSFSELYSGIRSGSFDKTLSAVYTDPEELVQKRERIRRILDSFAELFSTECEAGLFSAPGRTEVCGNHTDHNHGRVLAAGVNLDAIAAAAPNGENIIRVKSEGHDMNVVELSGMMPSPDESGCSTALVRGVCAGFLKRGYKIGGFNATTASEVLSGSGLSSSAAFEVLLGTILSHLFNDGKVSPVEIAQIAQYAENVFFGKPCGLMDQTASAVGGFVTIDFKDPSSPVIEKLGFDFASCGHALCITDTGGSHADLTDEYAAVRREMESVAACFGQKVLRDVPRDTFMADIADVRKKTGDRAVLRAIHFYNDNERVAEEVATLNSGDFDAFKKLVIESGESSFMLNQNVFSCGQPESQPVSLALALSCGFLKCKGAWRVHGGGFAGTVQAFVPDDILRFYKDGMERVFGVGSCKVLKNRAAGGVRASAVRSARRGRGW